MAPKTFPDSLTAETKLREYKIDRILGRGSFGITYLAQDAHLHMPVAIKEFFPSVLSTRGPRGQVRVSSAELSDQFKEGLDRFLMEARTLAKFRHPNIVQVFNFFPALGTAYMVMPYEEGDSLAIVLDKGQFLDERWLLAMVIPLIRGLEQLHEESTVHRDIKPGNILLRTRGEPLLIDFGAARYTVAERTQTLTAVLTPGYAPFEQYNQGTVRQGPWTDVYALGAVLYRCISGIKPVPAPQRFGAVLQNAPDPLKTAVRMGKGRFSRPFLEAVDHALAVVPENRPGTLRSWEQQLMSGFGNTFSNFSHSDLDVVQNPSEFLKTGGPMGSGPSSLEKGLNSESAHISEQLLQNAVTPEKSIRMIEAFVRQGGNIEDIIKMDSLKDKKTSWKSSLGNLFSRFRKPPGSSANKPRPSPSSVASYEPSLSNPSDISGATVDMTPGSISHHHSNSVAGANSDKTPRGRTDPKQKTDRNFSGHSTKEKPSAKKEDSGLGEAFRQSGLADETVFIDHIAGQLSSMSRSRRHFFVGLLRLQHLPRLINMLPTGKRQQFVAVIVQAMRDELEKSDFSAHLEKDRLGILYTATSSEKARETMKKIAKSWNR